MSFCAGRPGPCIGWVCHEMGGCPFVRHRPIDLLFADYTPAVHFVGFRGEEYHSAVRVFGLPDFIHRGWDMRAQREIAPLDTVVFARGGPADPPGRFSFDDSNEDEDPAALERKGAGKLARLGHGPTC